MNTMKHARRMAALALALPVFALGCKAVPTADRPAHIPEGYERVYQQDFAQADDLADVVCSDPDAWRVREADGESFLELFAASDYQPTHRSPGNIALFKPGTAADFVMDLEMMQSGREYNHRDLCLFFGVVDADHYYYAHMATLGDDNAHQIFIVNDAPRTPITTQRTVGVDWGTDAWHHVRLVRDADEGTIRVYFDDMKNPVLEASDTTFTSGYIGVGSFDDTGRYRNVTVWARGWEALPCDVFGQGE
ncbi:MAG: hypothetical protein ACIAXF_13015 [Phycisphaerales bacterium JB063]